ncbi:MAG: NlpC/P60 family protein, partial [Chloroflexota bacterium]
QSKTVEAPYEAGDLFFFGEGDSDRPISHVGVCMGGTKVMHSSRSRNGVYLDDLQEKESLRAIFSHAGNFLGK